MEQELDKLVIIVTKPLCLRRYSHNALAPLAFTGEGMKLNLRTVGFIFH